MNKKWIFVIPGVILGFTVISVITNNDEFNTSKNHAAVAVSNADDLNLKNSITNIPEVVIPQHQAQPSTTNRESSEQQADVEAKTESDEKNQQIADHLSAAFPDTSELSPDEIGNTDELQQQLQQLEVEMEADRARIESEIKLSGEENQPIELSEAELGLQRYELEQQIVQEAQTLEEQVSIFASDADIDIPPMDLQR